MIVVASGLGQVAANTSPRRSRECHKIRFAVAVTNY